MQAALPPAAAAALIAVALAGALVVRPWRQLQGGQLATPLLALATVLPWAWSLSWPAVLPLHWSGAPLAVLLLGWPLAVLLLVATGLSTLLTTGSSLAQVLSITAWCGILPATATLVLGYAVRRSFAPNPVTYLMGRAFLVPLLALLACALGAVVAHQAIAAFLLAMGETAWTCAVVSLLVACKPQWLATWSDALYLPPPARVPVAARQQRR